MSKQNELMGKRCRDRITGATGTIIQRIIWAYGCDKYILKTSFNAESIQQHSIICDAECLEILDTVIAVDESRDEMGNQNRYFCKKVRDKVSGFKGICTGRMVSLFSGDTYFIDPKAGKKHKNLRGEWIDEARIEIIGEGVSVEDVKGDKPGGEMDFPLNTSECASIMGIIQ